MGAPLAGKLNSVLLLADEKDGKGNPIAAPAVNYLAERSSEIYAGYILGGESAVSKTLADRILAATDGTMAPSPLTGQEAAGGEPSLAPDAAQLDGFGSPQLTAAPIG